MGAPTAKLETVVVISPYKVCIWVHFIIYSKLFFTLNPILFINNQIIHYNHIPIIILGI